MLARFERLMEQAVEGSLRRVFPAPLQPVQLAKAAARAMEQGQVVGPYGVEVPNRYELRLAPADLERFGDYRDALAAEVGNYLEDYARERGLHPVAEPRVELLADRAVPVGSIRARAQFADLDPARRQEVDAAVESTRRLRLGELAAAGSATGSSPRRERAMVLADTQGRRFPLEPANGLVRLGRATDNDFVLGSQRVSRYHAQLRWVESCWLVYDLNSTNGTWLGQQRVLPAQPRALAASASVRLGDQELLVQTEEPARGPA
jgi:hypothetical protein